MLTILDYDDFIVYKDTDNKYWYRENNEIKEVECIAILKYDILHDVLIDDEYLIEMFDCDVCGEEISDNSINYWWFKFKE